MRPGASLCTRLKPTRLSAPAAGRELEGFIPKSLKDFEELGRIVAAKYLLPHAKHQHYKSGLVGGGADCWLGAGGRLWLLCTCCRMLQAKQGC